MTHWISGSKYQTLESMFKYNSKEATRISKVFKYGDWTTTQGSRTDLKYLKKIIDKTIDSNRHKKPNEKLVSPLLECFENQFSNTVRYHNGLRKYHELRQNANCQRVLIDGKIQVEIHWGDSGTGKSHGAHERYPCAFPYDCSQRGFWGEGATAYNGEDTVIFNDFSGEYPWCQLKRVLDKYSISVNTKGSSAPLLANRFIFTSNTPYTEWYKKETDKNPEELNAFKRRITHLYHYEKTSKHTATRRQYDIETNEPMENAVIVYSTD